MEIFDSWLINKYIADGGIVCTSCSKNSLCAYEKAVKKEYTILLDVQSLSDGTIICFKECKLQNSTNKNGYVTNLTSIDVETLTLKDGSKVPTFEEALSTINGKVPVIVNIVNNTFTTKLESSVLKILKNYNGEYAVCSSNPNSVEYFKNLNNPDLVYGIKVEDWQDKMEGSYKTKALKKLKFNKSCQPKFIMYYGLGLPNRFVRKYKTLPLIATDITSQEQYIKTIKHCDNITFVGFEPEI